VAKHLPDRPDYPEGYFNNLNTDDIGARWEREDKETALQRPTERDGLLVLAEVGILVSVESEDE
jgi:hypothetical protein